MSRSNETKSPSLVGVLVTYRRPEALGSHLDVLAKQSRLLDRLVVVDNDSSDEVATLLASDTSPSPKREHLPMPENLGPAGGIARGLRHVLDTSTVDGWVVLLDDDDPPRRDDAFERLLDFAESQLVVHPDLAMVGMTGSRFDLRTGRTIRLEDSELFGPVSVDYVAGGQLPLIRLSALREVGVFREDLFFGFDDLDFALRLKSHGKEVLLDGDLAYWARSTAGRLGGNFGRPRLAASAAPWRRYYSVRNLIVILRSHGKGMAALRVTLTSGLAKPVVMALRNPRTGGEQVRLGLRAIRDGWTSRLGRRIDPPTAQHDAKARTLTTGPIEPLG